MKFGPLLRFGLPSESAAIDTNDGTGLKSMGVWVQAEALRKDLWPLQGEGCTSYFPEPDPRREPTFATRATPINDSAEFRFPNA